MIEALRVAEAGRHTVHTYPRAQVQSQGTSQALEGAVRRGQRRAVLARPSIQTPRRMSRAAVGEARRDVLAQFPPSKFRFHHSARPRHRARRQVRAAPCPPPGRQGICAGSEFRRERRQPRRRRRRCVSAADVAPVACRISSRARSSLSALRDTSNARPPAFTNCVAAALPMPDEPPTTIALFGESAAAAAIRNDVKPCIIMFFLHSLCLLRQLVRHWQ